MRGDQSSDSEGRRPGGIWLGGIGGKNVAGGRRADRMRVAVEPLGQGQQVGRNIGHGGLGGEAAERTLVAARTGGVLAGSPAIVRMGAELSRVPEQRFELGGDRCVIGAGESRGGDWGRRRGGE